MSKLKLLLLLSGFISFGAKSQPGQIQQIKIVNFTVKNQLPAVIDNWNNMPGSLLLVAQKPPTTRELKGVRLVLQIKAGGSVLCGSNYSNGLPVDDFTTRTFTANELTGLLSGCHDLKDGSYSICAQFFNIDRVAISNEVCKEFTVETPKETDYAPPTLITPENGKEYSATDMLKPVMFRWTPLVPKPREPVTYRLKVWQLMQGQTGTAAMRTNQPIVTKDVDNITQAVVSNIYTGPCRPPYLCDFIWSVQAVNREGKPIGRNNGTSEAWTFKVNQPTDEITPPVNVFPGNEQSISLADAQKPITFKWRPVAPKQTGIKYRLKVWQLMQGQNSRTAMSSNTPLYTFDVDGDGRVDALTDGLLARLLTGPCRPPYLCDFVWNVQALNKEGRPVGNNNGTSEPTTFKVTESAVVTENGSFKLVAPENGKKFLPKDMTAPVLFKWTAIVPKPSAPVTYRLKVWQLMQGQSGSQAMRSNKPIVEKEMLITEVTVPGIYTGPCRPPYLCDYVWQVQAVNREGQPVGGNEGKSEVFSFSVEEPGQTFQPPKLVAPVDGKKFLPKDMSAPTLFRWTPVVPKPQEPVTYRLKVWQLMQGQSGTQAMRSNPPIVTKDVDNITEVAVSGIYTGPCRPPYLCDFVWQVQAVDRQGHPVGSNEGKSEVWNFKVQNNIDTEIDSVFVSCCEKNVQNIYIRVKNNLANAVNIVSIKYKINGAGASIVLTPVTPAVPTTTIPGNGSQVFTATVKCITATFLKFLVDAEDVADPDNKETEVVYDTLKCICNTCDSVKIDVAQKEIKFDANGNINMNTTISVSPKPVKNIKAELVYFEYKPESDDCMLCNKDSKTFGNFANGTHSQEWNFSPPKNLSGGTPASMVITVPPTVKCCDAVIRWCIRYVITFDDCTVCNKLICYEKKKEGCAKGNINPNNDQK